MPVPAAHFVNGNPLAGPFPAHLEQAVFGLGWWGKRIIISLAGSDKITITHGIDLAPALAAQDIEDLIAYLLFLEPSHD